MMDMKTWQHNLTAAAEQKSRHLPSGNRSCSTRWLQDESVNAEGMISAMFLKHNKGHVGVTARDIRGSCRGYRHK